MTVVQKLVPEPKSPRPGPGLSVDEQIARVLERLAPHAAGIAAVARRLDAEDPRGPSAVLEIVRYFNDETGRPDHVLGDTAAEAPDLFGWHLGRDVLDFLHLTGAVLDVDEYDLTQDRADDGSGS
ncbi:DUF4279 domain-containing protein [Kitasatospora purpeofusca]|uniref:DUF4279 domain-containing protein n=1 Tax=Kitasatospora purpeofusca TaxID=67352 RepID=UPI002257B9AA|nr:DUF4279 domain-containing protein [Kitasatospora purpeofusca]MCX4682751.1 DUF4279 domain-containing protein [Kitasatospora purpeofusca]